MSVFGGYLKDIPKPHRRLFSDRRRKRAVRVEISRFYGIGVHYYVSLQLENNPVWNRETKTWQLAWDDTVGRGTTVTMRFNTESQAKQWVAEQRSKVVHRNHVFYEGLTEKKWFYKEGD